MSSITLLEAALFSQPDPTDRYQFDARPIDQFFEILPMEPIRGHVKRINVADGSTLHANATLVTTNAAAVDVTLPTLSTREARISHFAAQLEIDSLVASQYSSFRDVLRAQFDLKVAAVLAKFQRTLVRGDNTNAGEFDGLLQMAADEGFVGADNGNPNGGIVLAGEVEHVLSRLAPSDGLQGRYLLMHSNAFHHLYKNNYSRQIFVIQHPQLGPLPAISGVPILLNDHMPNDQTQGTGTNLTTILAVNVGKNRGLCGILPAKNVGKEVLIRGPAFREGQDTMHFEISADLGLAIYRTPAAVGLNGVAHTL